MSAFYEKISAVLDPLFFFRVLRGHGGLVRHLLVRQLTARYRSSALGLLWSVLHPIFMLLIYTYVFREVFKVRWGSIADDSQSMFAVTMFCGMAFFNIFSESLTVSSFLIAGNVNFVKKIVFPLELLPFVQTLNAAILGSIWFLIVIIGTLVYYGTSCISWSMLLFPVIFLFFFLYTMGFSFLVASLGVFFRDTAFALPVILQVIFFITPIFYPVSAVPDRYRWVLEINPLSLFVDQSRGVLLNGLVPGLGDLVLMAVYGIVVFQLGFAWFMLTKRGFADVL